MGIPVKLQVFEGPLDLLLHLIEKNKVSIYEIPISEITSQYLAYIQEMKRQDLNIMSEFLVMAATLIDIKGKMLLPKEVNEEGEEIDPRQELVEQLLQYKMYKYMAVELKDRQVTAKKKFFKEPQIPKEVAAYEEPVVLKELFGDLNLVKLKEIFETVMKRSANKVDAVRSSFGTIEKEEITLEDRMEYLEECGKKEKNFSFRKVLKDAVGKLEVIVTFLAVLELMKLGKIHIYQEKIFDDIRISFY